MRALIGWSVIVVAVGPMTPHAASVQPAPCIAQGRTLECTIRQPIVTNGITDYRSVSFKPGDTVTVEAGGCVQTGGSGRTWKRYVDPQGPNSDRFYHGLIYIPGMRGLQRISTTLKKTISVPKVIAPGVTTFLRLGYEDDNFSDNGYWGRDDGTGDQCKGQPDAYVIIRIGR